MSPDDLPPPILITDDAGMDRLLADLDGQSEIAVDTEADSFFSYREKVCLIQITVEDRDYLVDPLADVEVERLGPMLADPERIKVFHDGEYDVMIMKRDYGFDFASLFDTRVAAAALGTPTPGLASVLFENFDLELDKSMQRSNWAQRPLSEKQVRYARLDTHFLLPLMHRQGRELDIRGRRMIVDSECRRLEALEPPVIEFSADEFVRLKGVRDLSPRERAVLRELYRTREELAEKWDQPPFRVMSNELLITLARRAPEDEAELKKVRGFTERMAKRLADPVLDAIDDGCDAAPINKLPARRKKDGSGDLDENQLELYERLKKCRKSLADSLGIESSYLINRHLMIRLAEVGPHSLEDLEREGVQDWQVEMFGPELLDTVRRFERDLAAGTIKSKRWRR